MRPRSTTAFHAFPARLLAFLLATSMLFHALPACAQALDRWFSTAGVHVVRLDSDEGTLRCTGTDMDEAHLSVRGSRNGGELRMEDVQFQGVRRGDTLALVVRLRRPSSPFAVQQNGLLDLGVPPDVTVDAVVEDGDIEARHLEAGGRFHTRDGGIHAEDCSGLLELLTRDGELYVAGQNGPLTGRLRNGSLRASGYFPRLAVQSEGGRVDVRLGNGSLDRPAGAPGVAADCWIRTVDGPVNLRLPKELQGILTVRTGGRLDAGNLGTLPAGAGRGPGGALRVLLGLGPSRVEVWSDSGSVTVR